MTDPLSNTLAALLAVLALIAGARGCLTRVRTPGTDRAVRVTEEPTAPARQATAVPHPRPAPTAIGRASGTRPGGPGGRRRERAARPTRPVRAIGEHVMRERVSGSRPGTSGTGDERAARERSAHGGPEGVRGRGRGHAAGTALLVAAGTAALLVGTGAPAAAHPLGNFSVNRYDGLVVAERELRVDHVEDLAEIPTARIRPRETAPAALAAWAEDRCAVAAREARLLVDGRAVPLETGPARASVRPGQAGLPTLRVECAMRAPLPGGRADLAFTAAPGEGAGWREITARGDRTTLASSDVPGESVSRRLSAYPQRLLESPPARTSARLTAAPGGPALGEAAAVAPPSVLPRGVDRWTQALTGLVERRDLTVPFGALALVVALGLGALHALAPGHGKTLMAAAAAAGGRNSLREVLALGASVTVTHTLGVLALGALIVAGSAVTPAVVGWLGMASGILVAVAGALLTRRAWQDRAHGRGHTHVHWLGGGRFRTHTHTHPTGDGDGHTHDHGHERAHGGAEEHGHDHEPEHKHGHHPGRGSERQRPLRRSILLGLAGGLVPSPSAVVVLVGAAALGHAWFGLLLVVAYGAGLALTLTAAGFAVVRLGGRIATRLARRRAAGRLAGLVQRSAPIGTALTVVVLGCGLALRGAAGAMS
ncbi:hypothetical protein QMZ92_01960 [Streptomyces sp. HNM0645]|uniref:urease accessory protein UreH domain-containing protein n=1 Tax=Streptomyces sp. HNM0645 TaxID=2782343 RepID=UPI0024B8579C|nr:sulfite exporter TauE/SafE family protein [Streptomyces sp. HNM0645]MDI9883195.1 hypothetical protein [Streptomyces sp. HNM0645]